MTISDILLLAQTASLTLATIFILMQNRGAGLSGAFGGSDQVYLTRRGIEKSVVSLTVLCIIAFIVLRILALYIG